MLSITSERLVRLPVFRDKFQGMIEGFREIIDFWDDIVTVREEQLKKNEGEDVEPRDFTEAYLLEMKRLEKQEGHHHYFS
jgi:hypothetical protein